MRLSKIKNNFKKSFKESLVQHEITVIKCENISMQEKVNKLLQFNKIKKVKFIINKYL